MNASNGLGWGFWCAGMVGCVLDGKLICGRLANDMGTFHAVIRRVWFIGQQKTRSFFVTGFESWIM